MPQTEDKRIVVANGSRRKDVWKTPPVPGMLKEQWVTVSVRRAKGQKNGVYYYDQQGRRLDAPKR